jgi:hypothetical protein
MLLGLRQAGKEVAFEHNDTYATSAVWCVRARPDTNADRAAFWHSAY